MKNKLFYGENLENLHKYIESESVDLCYIDPPFNSDENYNQTYSNKVVKDKAQAQAFIDTWTWNTAANLGFKQITEGDSGLFPKQNILLIIGLQKMLGSTPLMAYLVSMTLRISEIYRVLKPTGSFYLHCDPTASHYLKLILDSFFCSQGGYFKNEIVWKRTYDTGAFKIRKNSFANMQDTIFFYTKSPKHTFHPIFLPYPDGYEKRFNQDDEDGKGKYYWADLNKPSQGSLDRLAQSNELKQRKSGKWSYKRYFERIKNAGIAVGNIWDDIRRLSSNEAEALGYPTQKPEALLERIIKASSNEGDVVLDCYCGCGTTIAVAEKLKRKWIGIDITYQSISLILKRLEDSFDGDFTKDLIDKDSKEIIRPARLQLSGVPQDFKGAVALANKEDDRLRKEFEKWFVLTFANNRAVINDKKGGDGGIDGTVFMLDADDQGKEELKQVIFSVKSNKKLSPDVIRDLFGTMTKSKAVMGYLLTLYPMPNLAKEAATYGIYQNKIFGHEYPKIKVISVQELFDGKRISLPIVDVLKKAEQKTQKGLDMFQK